MMCDLCHCYRTVTDWATVSCFEYYIEISASSFLCNEIVKHSTSRPIRYFFSGIVIMIHCQHLCGSVSSDIQAIFYSYLDTVKTIVYWSYIRRIVIQKPLCLFSLNFQVFLFIRYVFVAQFYLSSSALFIVYLEMCAAHYILQ